MNIEMRQTRDTSLHFNTSLVQKRVRLSYSEETHAVSSFAIQMKCFRVICTAFSQINAQFGSSFLKNKVH